MAISDQERREVAAKLRSIDEHIDGVPPMCSPQVHNAMALRAIRAVVGKGDIFHLLADLIDAPERSTCHLMETDHEYEVSYRCSACKSVVWLDFKGNPRPDYCPKCGAKVVD